MSVKMKMLVVVVVSVGWVPPGECGNVMPRGHLAEILLAKNNKWIMAAAGATQVPPPFLSCVRITAYRLSRWSPCIISNQNLTVHKTRNVRFIGHNERGELEIRTEGPLHEYTIRRKNDSMFIYKDLQNEVDWEAAINQPLCWYPGSDGLGDGRPRKFHTMRYIIVPVDHTNDTIFLVGIKKGMPVPEYEVALLTRNLMDREDLLKLIRIVNMRNYDKMQACLLNSTIPWPSTFNFLGLIPFTMPIFWHYHVYCLPRLRIKCARGFDLADSREDLNQRTTHEDFSEHFWFYPPTTSTYKSDETDSVVVLHNG